MVRVLICDDQTVVREGLAAILSTEPEIEVVGLAGDGKEAVAMIPETEPDLVLMDLKMPVMNGIQATRRLRELYPSLHVLVLTTYAADDWIFDAVRAGASGYLLKDTRRDDLIAAIKGTLEGQTYIDPSIAGRLMQQVASSPVLPQHDGDLVEKLTPRELEVLQLIARGYSNPEIAERLFLASGTVRNYVSIVFQKLGVSDRTQAVMLAMKRGLIDEPEA
jgi:DNA-binding NarL/FixJ family response regulator